MSTTVAIVLDEVIAQLQTLRLPYMRRVAPELLKTARAQRWDPAEAVKALLAEEIAGRAASSVQIRRKRAGFPSGKTFSTWDEAVSSIPAPSQRSLKTLEWIERKENLVVCGPSGTGKSHFLDSLRFVKSNLDGDGAGSAEGEEGETFDPNSGPWMRPVDRGRSRIRATSPRLRPPRSRRSNHPRGIAYATSLPRVVCRGSYRV